MRIFSKPLQASGLAALAALLLTPMAHAQSQLGQVEDDPNSRPNVITTAVPFLIIAPDSRSGAMGEAGVAISPDAYSIHWNASKLAFVDGSDGFSISYSPWLRNLGVRDIGLAYLTYYHKFDRLQTFGAALRYFNLGTITFTDINGSEIGQYRPNEFSLDLAYARKLSDNFSLGITGRFIYSNLTQGQFVGAQQTQAGTSGAGDISGFYSLPLRQRSVNGSTSTLRNLFTAGFNVSNLGAKVNYTESALNNFLPANLRVGAAYKLRFDEFNDITFTADINKLLVPTPPALGLDTATGATVITAGKDPDVPPLQGVFQSFGDAPGGFREEMREINIASGVEYWYDQLFAIRTGFFYEPQQKGARQFLTFGAGLKYSSFNLDFAYLVPTRGGANSPLQNTLRFSLKFDMNAFRSNADRSGIDGPDQRNQERLRQRDNPTPPVEEGQ